MNLLERIKSLSNLKLFILAGGFLFIVGEVADLILRQQFDLWVQVIILVLMGVLLIYTMNRR